MSDQEKKTNDSESRESKEPEKEAGRLEDVTEQMAVIKLEGQEFELEACLAQDDKMLKTVLRPHFSSIENAQITRDVKNGKLEVKLVKKARHKGR